jgi:hypothetical protein
LSKRGNPLDSRAEDEEQSDSEENNPKNKTVCKSPRIDNQSNVQANDQNLVNNIDDFGKNGVERIENVKVEKFKDCRNQLQ